MSRQPDSKQVNWLGWLRAATFVAQHPPSHATRSSCQTFPFTLTRVAETNALFMRNNKMKRAASVNVSVGLNSRTKSLFSFSLLEMSQGMVLFDVSLLYLVWCWHFLCGWTLLLFAYCCHDNSASSSSLLFPALCLVSWRKQKTLSCPSDGKAGNSFASLLWKVTSEFRGKRRKKNKPWCTFVRNKKCLSIREMSQIESKHKIFF